MYLLLYIQYIVAKDKDAIFRSLLLHVDVLLLNSLLIEVVYFWQVLS